MNALKSRYMIQMMIMLKLNFKIEIPIIIQFNFYDHSI